MTTYLKNQEKQHMLKKKFLNSLIIPSILPILIASFYFYYPHSDYLQANYFATFTIDFLNKDPKPFIAPLLLPFFVVIIYDLYSTFIKEEKGSKKYIAITIQALLTLIYIALYLLYNKDNF